MKTPENARASWKRYYARTREQRCADSRERYHHLRKLGLCTRCKEPSKIGICHACLERAKLGRAA